MKHVLLVSTFLACSTITWSSDHQNFKLTLDESIKKLECTLLTIEESFARKDIHVNTMTDFKETVIKMCESASYQGIN